MGGGVKDKDVRQFIDRMVSKGWRYEEAEGRTSHPAGVLLCPEETRDGCRMTVYSTPKRGQLDLLRRAVKKCPHESGN